ncbi:hypothetical protein PVK06_029596 [Gossypium arboreum]|uniref:Protein NRT1/ PTR FAMILY 1.2-like n=1 Tax=Gossypium arboreum TaxID=29729 RepID=A0ABR0P786_GOSAR|nr:hypothetical protein PVK06_029596 [Gossypium arboreum]
MGCIRRNLYIVWSHYPLWSTAMIPQARPYCDQFNTICEAPTTTQLLLLHCSLGLISIRADGVKSSCMAFSADQLNERNKRAEFLQLVLCYINVCSSNRLASLRKRHIEVPSEVYHIRERSMLPVLSEKLRFLNKACMIKNPQEDLTSNGTASNPWSLCTIDQVEDLKALIGVMPLCFAGIMLSITVNQGQFMDRIALPLASKIKGKPSVYSAENRDRRGLSDEPQAVVQMSALWILSFYDLAGLAEAFSGIGQIEFCYSELPKTMSTIAAKVNGFGAFIVNLVASLIKSLVDNVTKRGGESWVSSALYE